MNRNYLIQTTTCCGKTLSCIAVDSCGTSLWFKRISVVWWQRLKRKAFFRECRCVDPEEFCFWESMRELRSWTTCKSSSNFAYAQFSENQNILKRRLRRGDCSKSLYKSCLRLISFIIHRQEEEEASECFLDVVLQFMASRKIFSRLNFYLHNFFSSPQGRNTYNVCQFTSINFFRQTLLSQIFS